MMNAIILAGGKGSRMETDAPKPLVVVRGKAILAHQIDFLLGSGLIDRIIVSIGHRADEIISYIQNAYPEAPIECAVEAQPLGTAGGLKQAMERATSDRVLVLNCDDLTDIDLSQLDQGTEHVICVAHPRLPFGRVLEKDGYAVFEEKPLLPDWISVGWYCFDRKSLYSQLPASGSLEYDVFPSIVLRIYRHKSFWQPLNTKKDLATFEEGWKK